MDTRRVEAFSDGVFAIALTLLILEIKVPHLPVGAGDAELFRAALALWPSYLAFLLSFFVVLVMWINHHELFSLVREADNLFLLANGLLLLLVTFVPFPTAVLAQHLGTPAANAGAAIYCGTFVLISIAYNLLFAVIARRRRLVRDDVSDNALARIRRAYFLGLAVYAIATALAVWNAMAGLLVCNALWLIWVSLNYRSAARGCG